MYYMTEEQYVELQDSYSGICLACGAVRFGDTEPDADDYPCEECGENKVQGIENALISGQVAFTDNVEEVTVEF